MIYQAIILIYECNDIKYFKLIRTILGISKLMITLNVVFIDVTY